MSDNEQLDEVQSDPEIEKKAQAMGWQPKERFRGDPEKWTDAATYVENGERILPVIRNEKRKVEAQLGEAKGQISNLSKQVQDLIKAQSEMISRQAEAIQNGIEARIKELKAEKRSAIKEGDHELAAALDEDLDDAKEKLEAAKAKKPEPTKPGDNLPADPQLDPEIVAWTEENPWALDKKEIRKQMLFQGICKEMYDESGGTLRGRKLLDQAKEEMDKMLDKPAPRGSKTEGDTGGNRGGGAGNTSLAKSFAALPKDAQEQCKKDAKRFVGPGKLCKDDNEWKQYFVDNFKGA